VYPIKGQQKPNNSVDVYLNDMKLSDPFCLNNIKTSEVLSMHTPMCFSWLIQFQVCILSYEMICMLYYQS
jgi:hypothetical protein